MKQQLFFPSRAKAAAEATVAATAEAALAAEAATASAEAARAAAPPPPTTTPTNPKGVRFLLASTQAWMGVAKTMRGQLAVAEGLVRFQLLGTSPNTPLDNVLPHVGSALESHARLHAHYTLACVAATATDPSFKMSAEP